jgi:hypothetical protein|tara:strand:- start:2227 stop:2508 length:282 start_codon:yes stop_codon:yes gene_type:complete
MRGGYPAFPTVDGPFDRAAKRIEKLATNIYLTALCTETIAQLQVMEEEYECALLSGDVIRTEKARSDLTFIEEVIKLSALNYSKTIYDELKEQ